MWLRNRARIPGRSFDSGEARGKPAGAHIEAHRCQGVCRGGGADILAALRRFMQVGKNPRGVVLIEREDPVDKIAPPRLCHLQQPIDRLRIEELHVILRRRCLDEDGFGHVISCMVLGVRNEPMHSASFSP